jgi:nucleoside phosphorylase
MWVVYSCLDPTAPIAQDALLVDDPKVAMDLAIEITESPRMSNLAHGLWGYHGTTPEGVEVTVQSLGIGGPSAAAVTAELADLGVARAIRIGSCISLDEELGPGTSIVATAFDPGDGAGAALSGGHPVLPDSLLSEALAEATDAGARGTVRSVDVVTGTVTGMDGAVALDLSSAAFAAASALGGIACACALVVSGEPGGSALGREALGKALIGLGKRAATVLGAVPQPSGS